MADIACDADGVCARGGDVGRRRLYLRLIEIEQGDAGAVRRKEFCGCLTDAALTPGPEMTATRPSSRAPTR